MMPGMDGFAVLQGIKRKAELASIPVVMLTVRKQESDIVGALQQGASDYVTKPFIPEELAMRVARLIPMRQIGNRALGLGHVGLANLRSRCCRDRGPRRAARLRSKPLHVFALLTVLFFSDGAHGQGAPEAERFYQLGTEARRQGQTERAIESLSRALELAPNHTDALLQLGLAHSDRQHYEEARRTFRRVLELAPNYDDARLALARTLFFERKLEEAEADLRPLLERSPVRANVAELRD
jgi:tetratricopeptide (TPR) repeat protein